MVEFGHLLCRSPAERCFGSVASSPCHLPDFELLGSHIPRKEFVHVPGNSRVDEAAVCPKL